jgi:hypothetical protein
MWQISGFYSGSDENTRLVWYDCRLREFSDISQETADFKIHGRPHRLISIFLQPDVTWFVIRAYIR